LAVYPSWDPTGAQGWTTLLDDEFTGSSLAAIWQPGWFAASGLSGPVNSAEFAQYNSANVTVSGGYLNLALNTHGALVNTNPGNSGTATGFTFTPPAAFEARIYLPTDPTSPFGIDNWPAFWVDTTGTWPQGVEVDVMEGLGDYAAYHVHDSSGGPGANVGSVTSYLGWHTFGAYWQAGSTNQVDFYYDGVHVGSEPVANSSPGPHFLILDYTAAKPAGDTNTMLVDWCRVWAPGVSGGGTGGGTTGSGGGTGGTGGSASGGSPGGLSVVQVAQLPATQITANPAVIPLNVPTTPGNCLVACIGYGNSSGTITISSVKSGQGTTPATFTGGITDNWAQTVHAVSASFYQYSAIWTDPDCTGGQTAIEVTTSSATNNLEVVVYEVFDVATSSVADQTNTGTGSSTAYSSGSVQGTVTGTTELAIGTASIFNAFPQGPVLPSGWTAIEPQGDITNMAAGYQLLPSGAAAVTFAGSQTATGTWAACALTLKSAATVASGGTPGSRPGRSLLVSLAPVAGTDGYGNAYPAGLQVGSSAAPQVAVIPNAPSGAAEVEFPLPIALSNIPNVAGGVAGVLGELAVSGPALPNGGVNDDDWVQLVLWSDGSGVPAARGELRYIASGGTVTVVAKWDDLGFQIPTGTVPSAPTGACVIYYEGGALYAKGPSGTAVKLATT
jgi:hypothetical protein